MRMNESKTAQYIKEFLKLPYISYTKPEDLQLSDLPTAFCKSKHILQLKDKSGQKTFVVMNPFDWELPDFMMKFSGLAKTSNLIITAPQNVEFVFKEDIAVEGQKGP